MHPHPGDHLDKTILQTDEMLSRFFETTATMSVADYDVVEHLSAFTALLEYRDAFPVALTQYCDRVANHGSITHTPTPDGQILARACFEFVTDLAALYNRLNLWDENGHAPFYFHRLLGRDMVIAQYPP